MEEPVGGKPKKGHGGGSREKRLRSMPHWPEIEIRLRHRWSPDEVIEWHQRTHPAEPGPARRTLYRFLQEKHESWFLEQLLIGQSGTERVPSILVLERHANLIETQTMRLNKALNTEAAMNGLLYPELRANMELLHRMLDRHFTIQQEIGMEPKVTQGSKEAGRNDLDGSQSRELHELVSKIINLPSEEFIPALVALIGPTPVKQPLQLGEAVVIERKALEPNETP